MRRVLWILAVTTLVVALAWWVAFLPGTVSARVAGYSVEMATPLAAIAVFVAVLVIHLVLRLVGGLIRLPRAVGRQRRARSRRGGDVAVGRALVALAAGQGAAARREAQRARTALGDTAQTLLLAAEAARLAGNPEQAAVHYKQMAGRQDSAFLGLRGLFRLAMERQDWTEAAVLARRAEALQPGGEWLRETRLRLAAQTGDWSRALTLAGPDVPVEVVATAAARADADPQAAARLARQAWQANPGFTPAVLVHAEALRRRGRDAAAQSIVTDAWKIAPHPDLAEFLMAGVAGAADRLAIATKLSRANPEHLETQFLLARHELAAGDIKEARHHADRAHRMGTPTQRQFMLLAELATAEGVDPGPALRAAATAPADPGWRCGQCGTAQATWQPVCPACHTAGKSAWLSSAAPRLLTQG